MTRTINGYDGFTFLIIDVEGAVNIVMLRRKGIHCAKYAVYRYIPVAIHTS